MSTPKKPPPKKPAAPAKKKPSAALLTFALRLKTRPTKTPGVAAKLTGAAGAVKAGLASALATSAGKFLYKRFFYALVELGADLAIALWNGEVQPYLISKGYNIPALPINSMDELWAMHGELIRQLWSLVSNDPFPLQMPPKPKELQAKKPAAPPAPAAASSGGGGGMMLVAAGALLLMGGKKKRR